MRSNNPVKVNDWNSVASARERQTASGARSPRTSTRIVAPETELYFLTVHEPYRDEADGYTVGSTIVHSRTLLHFSLPQPDASMVYRCVTEFPGRIAGAVVPLSTVTFELNGGTLWSEVGDWEAVRDAVAQLARQRGCDSVRLPQNQVRDVMLAMGPHSENIFHTPDGTYRLGPRDRQEELEALAAHLVTIASEERPMWPGGPLGPAPTMPATLPYSPLGP